MPNYKDHNNSLHWLDDASFSYLLPDGSVEITQAEADALRAPTAVKIVAANDQAIFAAAETHKAAMESSADPANYGFSAGWPSAYGE